MKWEKNMQVEFSLESLSKHEWHDLNAVIKHMTKCYILYNSEIKVFKNSRISWYDIYLAWSGAFLNFWLSGQNVRNSYYCLVRISDILNRKSEMHLIRLDMYFKHSIFLVTFCDICKNKVIKLKSGALIAVMILG